MADDNDQKAVRTEADKDRSRQQSRTVSGREAARGNQGSKTSPKGAPKRGGTGPGRPAQGKGGSGNGKGGGRSGRRPPRSGASNVTLPRRSPTALLTWGVVALVVVVVVVLVVVKVTGTSTPSKAPRPGPVPASVVNDVTKVPTSVYNAIGVKSTVTVTAPKALSGQKALVVDGKPGVFYMGAEYCPYCAAERWAMVTSFSRFGSVTGLKTMESSSSDVYPSTQTFTFADAHFKSAYASITTREILSNQENSAGTGYESLQKLTKAQTALVDKFDTGKYTGSSTTNSHSFPFVDIGNKFLVSGASYVPSVLQGLSRTQIAAGLTTTKSAVTRAIISTSNYLSASICSIDGQQPASVCTSSGVAAAAKAMGLHA